MNSDHRLPRAIWRRAFYCSLWTLLVAVVLASLWDALAYVAAYKPLVTLSLLLAIAGFPSFLNFFRWLVPCGWRRRTFRKWSTDPVSWTGVVGVILYLVTAYAGAWVVKTISAGQIPSRLVEGAIVWGAVPVCYLGALVLFYGVTSWAVSRSRRGESSRSR